MEGDWEVECVDLEVPKGCSYQVNILQCTVEGIQVVGCLQRIRWKYVPLGSCLGKEAVFVVVVGGGYLSVFVWILFGFVRA